MPSVKLFEHGRQRLDRYELVGEIASGGMATVYLGRLLGAGGFQRFVAIKRLHPHLASEQEFVEMFLDEARLAASIHHPNVVSILEVGTSDRGFYLVMEYIEGDTMARLLARATSAHEKMPPAIVLRIIQDALAGLHAAHELCDDEDRPLCLVHRDVSPQNILVGVNGTARITDFGVARAATRLSSTRSGQLKGKLAYMAPEQARGGGLDRRADLFSLGTVLWEALADRRLFKGEGEAETLNRVLFASIPRLRVAVPTVPAALERVTMKALDRDPDKRFATAMEFHDELAKAARASQLVASAQDVASYVQRVLGQDIAQQREAVRVWLSQSESSRTHLDEATHERAARLGSGDAAPPPVPKGVGAPKATEDANDSATITHTLTEMPALRRHSRALLAALALTVLVALFVWYRHGRPRQVEQGLLPSSAASATLERPGSTVRAASESPVAPIASDVRAVTTDPSPLVSLVASGARPQPAASARRAKAPKEAGSSAPTEEPSDDIPRNPYR